MESSNEVQNTTNVGNEDLADVNNRTFTLDDMKKAFGAGLNRGVDVTLIIETNGKHNAISGFPSQSEWLASEYGC